MGEEVEAVAVAVEEAAVAAMVLQVQLQLHWLRCRQPHYHPGKIGIYLLTFRFELVLTLFTTVKCITDNHPSVHQDAVNPCLLRTVSPLCRIQLFS
eukprot:m.1142856 g.1142856  ORF g.1142856 m.1142856 type:complete len:96 (-) comp24456_c2_seq4:121-408(-)